MTSMLDRQGRSVEVPEDQAQAAYQSGQLTFRAGTTIPIASPEGKIGRVRAEDLPTALEQGARPVTADEEHKAFLDEHYGDLKGSLEAGGAGFARGLSFGLSDPAIVGAAGLFGGKDAKERTRTALADLKEAHPTISTGSEIAGVIAPMLIPGVGEVDEAVQMGRMGAEGLSALARAGKGASTVARTLGAIPRGVGELGSLAERGVAKLVGESSTSLLARAGQGALARGASGLAEGAAFGVGQQISEDTLGDHQLTAEKLLAAAGHGALMGGLIGGGLGAAGEFASTAGKAVLSKFAPKVGEVAEEQAWRATNGRKLFTEAADRIPGGVRGVGREMLDSGVLKVGDTVEQLAPKLQAAADDAGAKVSAIYRRADEAGFAGPKVADVVERVNKEILPELEALRSVNKPTIEKLGALIDDFKLSTTDGLTAPAADARATFAGMQEFRGRIDDLIRWQKVNPMAPAAIGNDTLKAFRGVLESETEKAGDVAAEAIGSTFSDELRAAKLKFRRLNVAADAVDDSLSRMNANAGHSLTDKIAGAAVGAAEVASHGPFGLLAGVATSMASKAVRERGNATAAVLLDKLANLTTLERAAVNVDTRIESGIKGFLKPAAERPRIRVRSFGTGEDSTRSRFDRESDAVRDAATQGTTALAAQHLGDLQQHAPSVSKNYASALQRAAEYLFGQLPPTPPRTPFDRSPVVYSDAQMHEWLAKVEAVKDPVGAMMTGLQAGTLSVDQVNAIRTVSPKLFAQMQESVMAKANDPKVDLTYQQRITLGTLFSVPADPSMEPESIASMQSTFAGKSAGGDGEAPGKAPRGKLKAPDIASESEQISDDDEGDRER